MKTEKKKNFKTVLAEIFLRQSFIEEKNKKQALLNCFLHDLKWVCGFLIFFGLAVFAVYLFG